MDDREHLGEARGGGNARELHPYKMVESEPREQVIEVSTSGPDDSRRGIGSSAALGDWSNTGIRLPDRPAPRDGQISLAENRFLVRLAGVSVPAKHVARVFGLRQSLTIGQVLRSTVGSGPSSWARTYPIEVEQTSPFWSFIDGNVAWHLRVVQNLTGPSIVANKVPPGYDTRLSGTTPAILCEPGTDPTTQYVALNKGRPPGTAVAGLSTLSTFRDLRFPWWQQSPGTSMNVEVAGPCWIVLFASVLQTDPSTRFNVFDLIRDKKSEQLNVIPCLKGEGAPSNEAVITDMSNALFSGSEVLLPFSGGHVLPPEEQFIQFWRCAKYHRIAGSIIADVVPVLR